MEEEKQGWPRMKNNNPIFPSRYEAVPANHVSSSGCQLDQSQHIKSVLGGSELTSSSFLINWELRGRSVTTYLLQLFELNNRESSIIINLIHEKVATDVRCRTNQKVSIMKKIFIFNIRFLLKNES